MKGMTSLLSQSTQLMGLLFSILKFIYLLVSLTVPLDIYFIVSMSLSKMIFFFDYLLILKMCVIQ